MTPTTDLTLPSLSTVCSTRLAAIYQHYLADIHSLELKSAMQYSLANPGKLLRPLLIYATGAIFHAPLENLDVPASAVELIHTYSLVHDDLPCMDDADLRRGKPSIHKAFSENMAVLTGDALHTLAMQILAMHPAPLSAEKRLRMITLLTQACGPYGMAAGQALDVSMITNANLSVDLLLTIYRLKTGALFSASIELGRLASHDEDELHRVALAKFGENIGLAFQIQDDILDLEATSEQLGKQAGIDLINNKITYPRLVGMQPAKDKVDTLYREALDAINYLGSKAHLLRELAGKMLERKK